jgi:hypothetical protein
VSEATCPKAFIKLLSLKGTKHGFKLLWEFIFQLSPQLDGIFIKFGAGIYSLKIVNGEHISKFYSCVQALAHKVCLANFSDANAAALPHQFLSLPCKLDVLLVWVLLNCIGLK